MPTDMAREARDLGRLLADRGLTHLRVTTRGKALTVVSGPAADPKVRLTPTGPDSWRLDVADHRGRWEPTPFDGQLADRSWTQPSASAASRTPEAGRRELRRQLRSVALVEASGPLGNTLIL
jgi:hypothetical protein